jgi:hypothetical protein
LDVVLECWNNVETFPVEPHLVLLAEAKDCILNVGLFGINDDPEIIGILHYTVKYLGKRIQDKIDPPRQVVDECEFVLAQRAEQVD